MFKCFGCASCRINGEMRKKYQPGGEILSQSVISAWLEVPGLGLADAGRGEVGTVAGQAWDWWEEGRMWVGRGRTWADSGFNHKAKS